MKRREIKDEAIHFRKMEYNTDPTNFKYARAFVRGLANTFDKCISMEAPTDPINVKNAQNQHHKYTETIKGLIPKVIEIPEDDRYPDCCFIEDTAVVIKDTAVISNMKAKTRAEEIRQVKEVLRNANLNIVEMQPPAFLDGGDVQVIHGKKEIWVGLSSRTNEAGAEALQKVFTDYKVRTIKVTAGLHLKSILTALDWNTILIVDSPDGREVENIIEGFHANYKFIRIPDMVAANIVRIENTILIQDGFPKSEQILSEAAKERNLKIMKLTMSELIKGDGALTCCSILV